jgi:pilus assembly protein CpaB
MKPKTLILMLVAIGCGLVAAILVQQLAARPKEMDSEKIPVAKVKIRQGEKINVEQMFEMKDYPKALLPPGEEVLKLPQELNGKVLFKTLEKGQFCTKAFLSDNDKLIAELPDGFVAMSLPVTMPSSVSGFSLPGSRVNLLCRYNGKEGAMISQTFLTNVKVIAVGTETTRPETGTAPNISVLTLAVTNKEAEKIHLAQGWGGQITLTLRNPKDDKPFDSKGTTSLASGSAKDDEKTGKVLQAVKDLLPGDKIDSSNVEEKDWPLSMVPPGAIAGLGAADLKDGKVQKFVPSGSIIMKGHLAADGVTPTPVTTPQVKVHRQVIHNGTSRTETVFEGRAGGSAETPEGSPDPKGSTTPGSEGK